VALVFLDLKVSGSGFLGDGGLARISEKLAKEGHRALRIEATWPAEKALHASFLASLAEQIRTCGATTVVLLRAWDAETLRALRAALGDDGKLLRLGTEVAALDEHFDAVVDEAGLTAWLKGAPIPQAERPKNARALRVLRARTEDDITPERAGERPAIRGPATGCPYLVDSAKQDRFRHLSLGENVGEGGEKVQTRGCTFCLDNTGTYAVASEDETVGRWLAQLRILRAERPHGRIEVLLVDERPHPYLPRLLRELTAAHADLAPLELLIKSRVDWLFEFEAEVREASVLAQDSKSVLHIYLVGFESFDDETLRLFNKGSSADDNVRAIALLRDLSRSFPASFEYRRLRAHGFVAFTPWTTPESLLRNARMMREVGFDELRSDAARTRLRLYPRTPLHALAEAEGLLSSSFGARGDRAQEQGYDASFAWRFADARVEAIFAACEGLRSFTRDLADADVLEIATQFVLRWPGLKDAPEVAHLPLIVAMRTWDVHPRDVATSLRAGVMIDLELERIASGEKAALLKEGVLVTEASELVRAYVAMGFSAAVVETHDMDATGGSHTEGASHAIVAVALDDEVLTRVLTLQRARDTHAMGALMGYPACCVEAFAAQPDRRDNLENERWTLRRSQGAVVDSRITRLGRVRLLSHHLCRVDCAESIAIADRALARVAQVSPEGAQWLEHALARPALFLDHARSAILEGTLTGSRFEVRAIETLPGRSLGTPIDQIRALEVFADRVVIHTLEGERRVLRADRPLLVIPGVPFAETFAACLEVGASRAKEKRVEAAPKWLELTPDYRCNQRCLGCAVTGEEGPSRTSRELVQALIDGRRQGITQLWIGGGEPTLRRDLLPLIREARTRGYARIRLQTNAAMLAYPEVATRLAAAGVTEISVSIKGADATSHDRMARSEGSFDLLMRGIANARASGLEVEGDVLLYRSTTSELPEVVRVFFAQGVKRFRVWTMAPDASDAEALREEPRLSEVAAAVRAACDLGLSEDPEHIVSLHTPPCFLRGDAARARFFAPELGLLVHDASGRRFRLEDSAMEGGAFPPRCEGCALRSRCGGMRADYLARHGDTELQPEPA
jgi:MoaA/NifB/PqqE/SkfB family radical SAM enzyme